MDKSLESILVPDTYFVLGWPFTNCVAAFSTPEEKELWFNLLWKYVCVCVQFVSLYSVCVCMQCVCVCMCVAYVSLYKYMCVYMCMHAMGVMCVCCTHLLVSVV